MDRRQRRRVQHHRPARRLHRRELVEPVVCVYADLLRNSVQLTTEVKRNPYPGLTTPAQSAQPQI